jgi:hypothetical protein
VGFTRPRPCPCCEFLLSSVFIREKVRSGSALLFF